MPADEPLKQRIEMHVALRKVTECVYGVKVGRLTALVVVAALGTDNLPGLYMPDPRSRELLVEYNNSLRRRRTKSSWSKEVTSSQLGKTAFLLPNH